MSEPYYKTSSKGVYVTQEPDPTEDQVTVVRPFPGRDECDFLWDSTWDREKEIDNRNVVYKDEQPGIRIPNVLIKPDELKDELAILWKPVKGDAVRLDFRKLEGTEPLWVVGAEEYGRLGGDSNNEDSDADYGGASDDDKVTGPEEQVEEGDSKNESDDIHIHVREYRGSRGKLVLQQSTGKVIFMKMVKKEFRSKDIVFSADTARVQVFPFPKGITFQFVDCGIGTTNRQGTNVKELCALYGPDAVYNDEEFKEYPAYDKELEDYNRRHMGDFRDALESLVKVQEFNSRSDAEQNL